MKVIKITIIMLTLSGLFATIGGGLLAYAFNTLLTNLGFIYRLAGFVGGLVLMLIGSHMLIVGIDTLRELRGR